MLAFGIDEVFSEARFLLLRQLAIGGGRELGYEFVIYTDRPQEFAMFRSTNLRLRIVHCEMSRFKAWRGAIDFVFRIKIEFLRDFCATNEGNVLYLDSDVYPRRDLTPLFDAIGQGQLFMCSLEGAIDESPWYADFRRLLVRRTVMVEGQEARIPTSARMWNAGVIGFSTEYRDILDSVLEMTESMYPELKAPATEQFAFSYLFGLHGTIHDAQGYVDHYWRLAQRGFAGVIASLEKRFEQRPLAELVAATEQILPERLEPARPNTFGRLPHHHLYMRFPALWHAVSRFKRSGQRQAAQMNRLQLLIDSL